ncbi:lysylphosphatidylglycerol synthase transmembrane domain-containing protein [Elongatibacter sediminis]|uniref:Lysylphosphatidylglycerol synthase transmembrane domain-containing protein n=1 Tax=Elongatibacter sediminis TaxID=3119006 RepID=A0AAW9RKU5_9GAMM
MNKKRWKTTAKVVFGLALLFTLLGMVDHASLWDAVKTASPPLLIASFALFASQGIFECGRLRIVFAGYGIGWIDSARLFLVGLFFGNFMPGMIGADVYQVQQMHAIRPGLIQPLSLSAFLRATGLVLNAILAGTALLLGAGLAREDSHIAWESIGNNVPWTLICAGIAVLLLLTLGTAPGRRLGRTISSHVRHLLGESIRAVRSLTAGQQVMLWLLGICVIFSRVFCYFLLLAAVGSSATIAEILLAVTFTALAVIIPVSFAGLGIREASLAAVLIVAGVEPAYAVAVSLISRCYIWMLSIIGGTWFVLDRRAAVADTSATTGD